jgi:hypothetical protein
MKLLNYVEELPQRLYQWLTSITHASIMKTLKHLLPFPILLFCVYGAFYCFDSSANAANLTPRESALLNYLLCLFSVLASWLASHYYAVYSAHTTTAEKIDTIAQQSTEKIMNQSAQLWEVERFMESSVEIAESEESTEVANNTLRNRMQSSAQMIRLLRSSNSTFTSDWAGVATDGVRKYLESQVKKQQELFKIYEEAEAAEPEPEGEGADEREHQRTREPNRRLQEVANTLPAAALPTAQPAKTRAVTTTQFPKLATNTLAEGGAILRVIRPVANVTGYLRFTPEVDLPANVALRLATVPEGVDAAQLSAHAGAIRRSGCPIHVTSNVGGNVSVGEYKIEYKAGPAEPLMPPPQAA